MASGGRIWRGCVAWLWVVATTVAAPPVIDVGPVGRGVVQGGRFTLEVGASGTGPLAYQWFRNGVALAGATGVNLTVTNAQGDPGLNFMGPSTGVRPFVETRSPGYAVQSLFSAGDTVNNKPDGVTPYRFAGIPDGLGAYDNGDGTFTVLVTHEVTAGSGLPRRHGVDGAFITRLVLNRGTLAVVGASDLITNVFLWSQEQQRHVVTVGAGFSRFCSADLPVGSAFFNSATGLGTTNKILLCGEEVALEGRAFAHVLTGGSAGNSYELPQFGRFAHENVVASPFAQNKTVVVTTDDTSPAGQVYVYVGTKSAAGSEVERAGLLGGNLFGVVVTGLPVEAGNTTAGARTFSLVNLGDVSTRSGPELESVSVNNNVTLFQRPEDGAWDPRNPRDFYFVTTASFEEASRLWRLRFTDIANPEAGGTIDMLLDGNEGYRMLDNLTFDADGNLLLQEDPSNNALSARIWKYDVSNDNLLEVARHKPSLVTSGQAGFLTQDEESSGIIDVSGILGYRAYLFTVQLHGSARTLPGLREELVDDGQLLLLRETDAGNYYVRVSNGEGVAVSENAVVTVAVPPSIDVRLQSRGLVHQVVAPGRSATFVFDPAGVVGTGPFVYQWLRDNTVIPGANGESLTVNNVGEMLAGNYSVRVTGAGGTVVSAPGKLGTLRFENRYAPYLGLEITGPRNGRFQLQQAASLNGTVVWTDISEVTLAGSSLLYIGGIPPGTGKMFYRAIPLP